MVRHALDSLPMTLLFVAGAAVTYWKSALHAYSETAHAIAVTLLLLLAAYKCWQLYRDRNGVEGVLKATASVAGVAAKLRFAHLGAIIATGAALIAFGAWLFSTKRDQSAVVASAAPIATARRRKSKDDAGEDGTEDAPEVDPTWPEWYKLAHADLGVAEIPGRKHNARVVKYYALAGHPGIKDDETAWCAAFVGAMLELAKVPCTKSLMARTYEKWGEDASGSPKIGDVVVIWRDKKASPWGHVFFYGGETKTHIKGLGGNQNNAVTFALFPKSRVTAIRRPRSLAKSRTVLSGAGTVASAVTTVTTGTVTITNVLDEAGPAIDTINQTGDKVSGPLMQTGQPKLVKIGLCIIIGCAVLTALFGVYTMWRRAQDKKARGH